MGNEVREGRYWEGEERRRCRLCGSDSETWEHIWEECRDWGRGDKNWQQVVSWVLGDDGEGEWWMRDVERERGEIEDGGKRGGRGVRRERSYVREESVMKGEGREEGMNVRGV